MKNQISYTSTEYYPLVGKKINRPNIVWKSEDIKTSENIVDGIEKLTPQEAKIILSIIQISFGFEGITFPKKINIR